MEDSCSLVAGCEVESRQQAARHSINLQGFAHCEIYFLQLSKLLKFRQSPQTVPPAGETLDRKKISYSLHSHVLKGIILNVCLKIIIGWSPNFMVRLRVFYRLVTCVTIKYPQEHSQCIIIYLIIKGLTVFSTTNNNGRIV